MNQMSFQQVLLQKLEHFLELNNSSTKKAEVQAASEELSNFSKELAFLPTAYQVLLTMDEKQIKRKEKQILLTSLIKDKFKFEWEPIAGQVQSHYNQLIELAQHFKKTFYAVYTNITMALAYLYIHMLAVRPIDLKEFLKPFTVQVNLDYCNYYLKTLEYIGTEIDNNKFVIDDIQREAAHSRLTQMQLLVLKQLEFIGLELFHEQFEEKYKKSTFIDKENVLYCFQAWITVHYNADVLNNLPNHFLFKISMSKIDDQDCGEGACNVLRSIIYQLKSLEENKVMFDALSGCTLQILGLIQQSEHSPDSRDEKAEDFLRLIADFARKNIKNLVCKYDKEIDTFLRKLIRYIENDFNIYESLVDFFEGLITQVLLSKKQKGIEPDANILLLMDPFYDAICQRCRLSSGIIKELNFTEESKAHHLGGSVEEIMRNRDFTEIIFQKISELKGDVSYLHFVCAKMLALNPGNDRNFESKLEVYLFSLVDAAYHYPQIDHQCGNILQMYIQLSGNSEKPLSICVRRSFLKVFRELVTSKTKDLEFAYRIICLTVTCFDEPLLSRIAEKTFDTACYEYQKIAVSIFKELGPILEKHPQRSFIVRGVITIMCNDSALTVQYLGKSFSFLFEKFKAADKSKRKEYMHSVLQALKAFQESPMFEQHVNILVQFVRDEWEYMMNVLGNPQRVRDDEDSDVEKMVRVMKIIMRTLKFSFAEFLERLFSTVLQAFSKFPICSYIYLVQVTVTIFSADPRFNDYLSKLYSSFCDIAFEHMRKIDDLDRFSFLLDDFMGMQKRFFLYNSSTVLASGKLDRIIDVCISTFMGCNVPRVAKAAYSYFETIFMVYWPTEHLQHYNKKEDVTPIILRNEDFAHYQALRVFLVRNLPNIVTKMMEHLSNAPTEQTRDYILDALVSELKAFMNENFELWLYFLKLIPSEILVQQQKERMMEMLKALPTCSYSESRKKLKALDKMLVLINRRMSNAKNRKDIVI